MGLENKTPVKTTEEKKKTFYSNSHEEVESSRSCHGVTPAPKKENRRRKKLRCISTEAAGS